MGRLFIFALGVGAGFIAHRHQRVILKKTLEYGQVASQELRRSQVRLAEDIQDLQREIANEQSTRPGSVEGRTRTNGPSA